MSLAPWIFVTGGEHSRYLRRFCDHNHRDAAFNGRAVVEQYRRQKSRRGRFDLVENLLGLNFVKRFARVDALAGGLEETLDRSFVHREPELGHRHFNCHSQLRNCRACLSSDYVANRGFYTSLVRDRRLFERRTERDRHVERRDAPDRCVEEVEALVGDDRGDIAGDAAA